MADDAGSQGQEQGGAGQQEQPSADVAKLQTELETLRKELNDRKKAEMSEVDRLKAELEEHKTGRSAAEERANRTLVQSRFERAAAEAGCVDPDAAFALLGKDAVRVDESGKVVGVKAALDKLKTDKPYLFGGKQAPRQVGAGGGNPPGGTGAGTTNQRMNRWIRSRIQP